MAIFNQFLYELLLRLLIEMFSYVKNVKQCTGLSALFKQLRFRLVDATLEAAKIDRGSKNVTFRRREGKSKAGRTGQSGFGRRRLVCRTGHGGFGHRTGG